MTDNSRMQPALSSPVQASNPLCQTTTLVAPAQQTEIENPTVESLVSRPPLQAHSLVQIATRPIPADLPPASGSSTVGQPTTRSELIGPSEAHQNPPPVPQSPSAVQSISIISLASTPPARLASLSTTPPQVPSSLQATLRPNPSGLLELNHTQK